MMLKRFLPLWFIIFALPASLALAQLEQDSAAIISFTADVDSVSLADLEAGSVTATFSWVTFNTDDTNTVALYAYRANGWQQLAGEGDITLDLNGSFDVPVQHPLNFGEPVYRLLIFDANRTIQSEATVIIPIAAPDATPVNDGDATTSSTETVEPPAPEITVFEVEQDELEADDLFYGSPVVNVAWEVENRVADSHLVFEQVLPDGEVVSVELSRSNPWVFSSGQGVVAPVYPDDGEPVELRLRLFDLITGDTLDEAEAAIAVTGTLSQPTAAPVVQQPAQQQQQAAQPAQPAANTAPVANAGTSGSFELGGHVQTFARMDIVNAAGMSWVKKQVRWNRGDGTGAAGAVINDARANGKKVLLGIVGFRDQMGDYEQYTNEFAAYLGQVAALGPDAIEVWNEPNIEREWPTGNINGATYTVMLSKAFNAIKAANGNVMVISAAPAPTGFFGGGCAPQGCDDNVFLRQMVNAGATQYMDCVGAHYNEGIISPDQSSGDPRGTHYTRYFTAMLNLYYNTFGGARQVCWTELGYLTGEGYAPLPGGFAWAGSTTLSQHAEWLGRAATLSRNSGRVRMMIVWNVDFTVYGDDPQAGYAILRPDGQCPACATLAAAVQ